MGTTRRKAATTRLEPGEHSIDRNTPTRRTLKGREVMVLDWSVRLHDGRLLPDRRTQGATAAEVRRKAKRRADELLATGGHAVWKGSDKIERYLDEVTAPLIEDAGRPATVLQYRRVLKMVRSRLAGHSIVSAWHYDVLTRALHAIASEHGAESARQARSVLGKYVGQPMQRHRLVDKNPLEGARLDLKKNARPVTKPKVGGRALNAAEQERVITWLLFADPAQGVEPPKRGRWTLADRVSKRRGTIDLTILQAGTGLRISEALQITCDLLYVGDDGVLRVNVTKEIAKTGVARQTPVADPRIEAHLLARLNRARSPKEFVVGSPADPMKRWSSSGNGGAGGQVAILYRRLAEELDIPLMEHARTHLWRTTLSSRYAEAGVDREDYSAALGHDEQTNEASYTDRTDTSALVQAYRRIHAS
ncbi:tyrosine-type recombinase/integrase [Georgenia sp. Z1491]|uniref:tyrosine-type recombinase/integrase n=1 Tax=Georgenia sp. Z1491 TaxID=3416707 RepID=UPI003CEC032E